MRLNLALQGGGAHGAFTWGVLDRLLEEEGLEIACISATSAGAVNAVALAAGWVTGGREGARQRLRAVWDGVERQGLPEFMRGVARASMAQIISVLSPYEFNPLGFDPLRNLLNAHVDFDRLRAECPFELLIAATEVATGHARLFRRHELTVECVLASACLPSIHRAVEIAGRHYWDGGYSANPDLVTLATESDCGDTLLVLLSPLRRQEVPTRAKEIASQINTLTFNAPLLRDAERMAAAQELGRLALWAAPPRWRSLARHRLHLIEAGAHTGALDATTKMEPDGRTFSLLHAAGRQEAEVWLRERAAHVGRRSTVDLARDLLQR